MLTWARQAIETAIPNLTDSSDVPLRWVGVILLSDSMGCRSSVGFNDTQAD
jgi:hypothetical protein